MLGKPSVMPGIGTKEFAKAFGGAAAYLHGKSGQSGHSHTWGCTWKPRPSSSYTGCDPTRDAPTPSLGLGRFARSTSTERACHPTQQLVGPHVDEILSRAGIFQGVEPNAASALTSQLQPADFPRGHIVFAQGKPGDLLYIIISGQGQDRQPVAERPGDSSRDLGPVRHVR